MTIHKSCACLAQELRPRARTMSVYKNPFITLFELELLCKGNEILEECLNEMVTYSLRYTETVCRFEQIIAAGQKSNEDDTRAQIDRVRSTIHDASMASINALSRLLKKEGKENSWIRNLVAGGRATYGKFALLIAFEAVLSEGNDE